MKYIYILFIALLAFTFSCGESPETSQAVEEEEMHEEGEEVGLNPLQIQKIGLEMGRFEQKNLSGSIKVNGVLEIPPQNKASVSTLISGQVSRIHVKPGQYIARGGLLATVQNTEIIEWQEQYMEAKGSLVFLTKEHARQKNLLENEIAAQKQFEKVESELQITKAHHKSLQSKLRLVGIDPEKIGENFTPSIGIRSPIGGFVKEISINTGSYVESNQELFQIVDNHHIHIDLKVYEKDLPYLSIGQKINFSIQSQPSEVMQASIFAIGKAMNIDDRTVTVHAEIDNKNHQLLPGMFVEARIVTENQQVQALPEEAITTDKGLNYIFVKEEEHEDEIHFKKVQVLLGSRDIGYVEINPLESLTSEDEIVVKGAYFLMAQSKKGEEGGGHHH